MKRRFLLFTWLAMAPAMMAAETKSVPAITNVVANATNWFAITGMHCDACAKGLTFELKRAPGVANATVSFTNKLATVAYDTNRITLKSLQAVVAEAGYAAKPTKPPKASRR